LGNIVVSKAETPFLMFRRGEGERVNPGFLKDE
jgi:hypothetical protein